MGETLNLLDSAKASSSATIWNGCYDETWRDIITPDAFAHPAKFSRGLIISIINHGLERGYWKVGDTIGDCFGGIGSGGIECAYRGLKWIGVELEPKFVALAQANFELHRYKLRQLGFDVPTILKGDSRQFDVAKAGASQTSDQRYGDDPAQIAKLRDSGVEAVITSPPWENNSEGKVGAHKWKDPKRAAKAMNAADNKAGGNRARHATTVASRVRQFERDAKKTYGDSNGQIGKDSGETYWQAMALVYAACFRSIKPGGYIVVVVKDYVKNKARVPLCDDTLKLLEHVGFVPVERIHAMLVEETTHDQLFGAPVTTKRERKSFFRRLAEKKGSPRIDYEEVLICRKPVSAADAVSVAAQ